MGSDMNIETTPCGSRFPDKPYFPLYLGNGVDAMLINLLGSGDAWFELCDYGAPLTVQRAPGWYKCDRRTRTNRELIYGILFPLFEFASSPFLNGDLAVPRDVRQYFDPRQATLTTFYEQMDHETLEWMRVKVTTFLTREHVLVEHYEFLETPASGAAMVFFLNTPSEAYLNLYDPVVTLDSASLRVEPSKSRMTYDYAFEKYRGRACSWFDCESGEGSTSKGKRKNCVFGSLRTRPMRRGESFTRYLVCVDNEDSGNHVSTVEATLGRCRRLGYRRVRDLHQKEWRAYFATSHVEIPDPALTFVYEVSRYLVRCNLHPSGFLPMGNLPYLWQGVMFWDAGFAMEGLMSSGNLAEARRVLDHLDAYMPAGREMAPRYDGARGARLEWTVEREKFTKYPSLTMQVHNNTWWAHTIHALHHYTRDVRLLRRHFRKFEDLVVFVADHFLEDRGDHAIIRECCGPDESLASPKTNDTWTCAVTLKALMEYRDAARLLKRRPMIAELEEVIRKLGAGLDRNVDGGGVLQSFHGGRLPHWGSLIFDLFPDHPALKPTLAKMMRNYDPGMKLYNMHGVTRYAEKAFPWCSSWAARIFSRIGDPSALRLVQNALKCTNYFGGFPERIFYHGERFNNWFITAHGSLVWAVNGMLANANGDTLRILGGAHPVWRDARFEGIHAGRGLVVSAEVRRGRLLRVGIVNLDAEPREIVCVLGNTASRWRLGLRPGANRFDAGRLRQARSDRA